MFLREKENDSKTNGEDERKTENKGEGENKSSNNVGNSVHHYNQ